MLTVAFKVFRPNACWLMRSISPCLVALCNFAVLVRGSTIRVRNKHPVSPRRSASRKIEMTSGERCILNQESDGPKYSVYLTQDAGVGAMLAARATAK